MDSVYLRRLDRFERNLETVVADVADGDDTLSAEFEELLVDVRERTSALRTKLSESNRTSGPGILAHRGEFGRAYRQLEADLERIRHELIDDRSEFERHCRQRFETLRTGIDRLENEIEQVPPELRSEYRKEIRAVREQQRRIEELLTQSAETSGEEFAAMRQELTNRVAGSTAEVRGLELSLDVDRERAEPPS